MCTISRPTPRVPDGPLSSTPSGARSASSAKIRGTQQRHRSNKASRSTPSAPVCLDNRSWRDRAHELTRYQRLDASSLEPSCSDAKSVYSILKIVDLLPNSTSSIADSWVGEGGKLRSRPSLPGNFCVGPTEQQSCVDYQSYSQLNSN
jgi:hypothetical protein